MTLTIVESESYQRMKAAIGDDQLADEIQQSFDLILANDPYFGDRISPFGNLYLIKTNAYLPRVPVFRVLYVYDKRANPDIIELVAIEPVSPWEDYFDI